ncbi:MAG: hypothetical protein A2X12_04875 [Bacteroidetes bacterium GWE2_29_8]|nr:MAG: hypothetical protein A2X12_04875 [Bacteroidetes bacterium GWE2_29_8]OFY24594.1 MAG: hypothetical protein A2X02_03260 [Bacteroidetes bacterium GWF2_29_10]
MEHTKVTNSIEEYKPITAKANIEFETFEQIDLIVATITSTEKVAKTKKLLKLTLNTGLDSRILFS